MPTIEELRDMQSLNLPSKVLLTEARIRKWVAHYGLDKVYVSFSGGKDSTVLLHIAREMYPDIPACFVDTGLEYPEIKKFVKTFDNVDIIRPKKTFKQVICEYGYPMISKSVSGRVYEVRKGESKEGTARWLQVHGLYKTSEGNPSKFNCEKYLPLLTSDFWIADRCCKVMKKTPLHSYSREKGGRMPLTAQMASESAQRESQWLKNGCNGFEMRSPISNPMSFWKEDDVLQYIKENNIKIASVYGDIVYEDRDGQTRLEGCGKLCTTGCHRSGCIFCGFGAHLEKGEGRFERLKRTHPKLYEYCMGGGAYGEDGIWRPDNRELGMAHVIDELCKLYGKDFIKY
jgi:3'-phosphoadenosine 5'-phosphosulfate sulfotransferase (PAPS reductase)/FAD synthetase